MKKAISVPDAEFERFEAIARRLGMNRSEFYREAARQLADRVEGVSELTAIANAALAHAGPDDALFVHESEHLRNEDDAW
jgi:metal-responsive CopG/Arc/MetJ family transcriptional regulator